MPASPGSDADLKVHATDVAPSFSSANQEKQINISSFFVLPSLSYL